MTVSELKEYLNKFNDRADILYLDMDDRKYYPLDIDWLKIKNSFENEENKMTKEEFKAKAKEIVDHERFGMLGGLLFLYNDYEEMRVAHIPNGLSAESDMSLDDFLNKLYDRIKENLK